MNTTIQIRIDSKTKLRAQKAFKHMGLDMSSGLKYLLTQVGKANNLSYICDFGYMHAYKPKMLAQYEEEAKDALKRGKGYSSTKKMFDDIEAGK